MSGVDVRFAEELARFTTRKKFLNRAATVTVAGLSAWMVAGPLAGRARAHTLNGQGHCVNGSGLSACNPPHQTFCSGCNGHACPPGCVWTNYWGYASACWCTVPDPGGAYLVCCDCHPTADGSDHSNDCGCWSRVGGGRPEREYDTINAIMR